MFFSTICKKGVFFVEEFIKQLNEKEIYLYGVITSRNHLTEFTLYTKPDRELITFSLRNNGHYMSISLSSTHARFKDRQTKVYENGKEIIYEMIMNEFQKSDCIFLFYKGKQHSIFSTKGTSLEDYFEGFKQKSEPFFHPTTIENGFYIEKFPDALPKLIDFSKKLATSYSLLQKEDPTIFFRSNFRFSTMTLRFYYKGVQRNIDIFRKECSIIFSYEKEQKEFPLSSNHEVMEVLKKYLESCYKEERIKLIVHPSRYYFHKKTNSTYLEEQNALYESLMSHFSPKELEKYCFNLTNDLTKIHSYDFHRTERLSLKQFGDFWYVVEYDPEKGPRIPCFLQLYSSEQEAKETFQSLLLEKLGIS